MSLHKFLSRLFCVSFFLLLSIGLSSCGGGGSSSDMNFGEVSFSLDATPDGVGSEYRGVTKPAELNPENSLFFLESLYGFTSDLNPGLSGKASSPQFRQLKNKGISLAKSVSNETVRNRAVSEERAGIVSGTYKITGDINDIGLGVLVAEWNNFSDEQGIIVDGKSVFNVVEYDINNDVILQSTTKLINLKNTAEGKTIISNGYIVEDVNVAEQKVTTIFDMTFYNQNSGSWKAYDKLKRVDSFGPPQESIITGRLYRDDIGYIDISTPAPLLECSNCEPVHPVDQGELRFSDAKNNIATFSFSDHLRFNLKFVDDSQTETSRVADWREMNSWVSLNTSPYQPFVYINEYPAAKRDMVIEVGDIFDADGDEVTLVNTWKVNGKVIEGVTGNTLSHTNYKSLDDIEVSVVVVDSYGGRSEPAVRTTTVANSEPKVVVSDETFSFGETLTLDASNSNDPDGDSLAFKWALVHSHLPESLITIVNPDNAKTEVIVPASGTYHFSVIVKENINGELSDTFERGDVFLTVLPEDVYSPLEQIPGPVGLASSLRVADVTGDAIQDVIIAKPGRLLIKDYARNSGSEAYLYDSTSPHTILIEDMNNDGLNDFIVDQKKGFSVIKQDANGYFNHFPSYHVTQTLFNSSVNQIQTGHFNNDNLLDVVLLFNSSIEVFLQKEPDIRPPAEEDLILPEEDDTAFESPIAYKFSNNSSLTPFGSTQMRVSDVTGDSLDDIILMTPLDDNNFSSLVLIKQKPTGGFEDKKIIHPEIHHAGGDALALVDLNGDTRLDIVTTHLFSNNLGNSGDLNIFYQSELGTFDQIEKRTTEAEGRDILVKDIDNDGNPDLIINNNYRYTVHKQTEDKRLSPFWSVYDFVDSFNKFDIGDINADGKPDVVTENAGVVNVRYGK